MKRSVFFVLVCLGNLYAVGQADSPRSVVEQFLSLDNAGARLHTGPDAPIWKLTVDDGEPPAEPVFLVSKCAVTNEKSLGEIATVRVQCRKTGVVTDNGTLLQFRPRGGTVFSVFTLLKENDVWKITLSKLKVPPQVGRKAYLDYLDGLIALRSRKQPDGESRLASMYRLKAVLGVSK